MQPINQFLKKYIAEIAIALGIIGITSHILYSIFKSTYQFGVFKIVNFQDISGFLFHRFDVNSFNFTAVLFLTMLAVGGWHYKKSDGKDTRLLKFGFSILAINSILNIVSLPTNYLNFRRLVHNVSTINGEIPTFVNFLWPLLSLIPMAYLSFYLVNWMLGKQVSDFTKIKDESKPGYSYTTVSKWSRLGHWIFDMILMYYIVFPFFLQLLRFITDDFSGQGMRNILNGRVFIILFFSAMIIIYYLIFEGLFHATPIKFLTGTKVVDADNLESPSFKKIFGRSLCRRIPFEVISFLGKEGWHDSISGTTLVPLKKEGLVKWSMKIWAFLFILTYVGPFVYQQINKKIERGKADDFRQVSKSYKDESIIKHLNPGDILFFRIYNGDYKSDQAVVIVQSVTDKQVFGMQYLIPYENRINRSKYLQQGKGENWEEAGAVTLEKADIIETIKKYYSSKQFNLADTVYALTEIADVDNPQFDSGHTYRIKNDSIEGHRLKIKNDLCKIEVIEIEKLEGEFNLITKLPLSTNFDAVRSSGNFEFTVEEKEDKYSKFRMIVRCNGEEKNYIVFKYDTVLEFAKEITE